MKPKDIDYSKAISIEDCLPFYNDLDIDYVDEELFDSTMEHIWQRMTTKGLGQSKPLDWRQVIQTVGMIKLDLIRNMLGHKIYHDNYEGCENWK